MGEPSPGLGHVTHAPPGICCLVCEFKDLVCCCCCFTTKIIGGIQVFWFVSQFGKKIPTWRLPLPGHWGSLCLVRSWGKRLQKQRRPVLR